MIYFIKSQDHVKVGYTSNLRNRYKKYVTENPHPIKLIGKCNGGFDVEKKIHKQLKEFHFRGEWFLYNDTVAIKIAEIIKENRDNVEPTKTKAKREKKTYLKTYEALREYGTSSGLLVILPQIKNKVCFDLEISHSTFARHLSKLIKLKKITQTDSLYYFT